MTVRIRHVPTDGAQGSQADEGEDNRTIYDTDGYKYHLGPNEHMTSMDDGRFAQTASNATTYFGASVEQTQSPPIVADIEPFGTPGRS